MFEPSTEPSLLILIPCGGVSGIKLAEAGTTRKLTTAEAESINTEISKIAYTVFFIYSAFLVRVFLKHNQKLISATSAEADTGIVWVVKWFSDLAVNFREAVTGKAINENVSTAKRQLLSTCRVIPF
jgi:hypothetical protein